MTPDVMKQTASHCCQTHEAGTTPTECAVQAATMITKETAPLIDLYALFEKAKEAQQLDDILSRSKTKKSLLNPDKINIDTIHLSHSERVVVEEHERLSPHLIFEIIRRDGLEELQRPIKSLLFSGVVAGIIITFSFFCLAALNALLPDTSWKPIISKWGYTVGFIIVILGRMQLFTENTITTVVPIFKPFQWHKVWIVAKLWGIVLGSNLIGTTLAAAYLSIPDAVNANFSHELMAIAQHVHAFTPATNFIRGIPAGILIAAIVWMMPSARGFSIFLIGLITYFIALGDFTHVVVGSAEMAYAVMHGEASLFDYVFRFLLPTGFGNIIGGTAIFTLLVFVQIKEELLLKHFHANDVS